MDALTAICLLIAVPVLIEITGSDGALIALLLIAAYWSDIKRDSK